jgi:uncharacterized membrane protein YsdA (DUF1294 family)/cold shock CspA family protein
MRFEGMLKTWNEDRGFGFIEPIRGGEDVFVHIKAFRPRVDQPQVQQPLSFEIELGPQGKKRAKNVELIRRGGAPMRLPRESAAERGNAKLMIIPGFVLLFLVVGILWEPRPVLAATYVVASLITFLTYAKDKSAARHGAWRTSESTLHILTLAGGWPGALLAQHFLHHKSRKTEFQRVFWATVILNVAGFLLFCSPMGEALLALR